MLIVLLSLKVNTNSAHAGEVLTKEKIAPSDVYALLRNRKFWAFCLYVAGVAWMMFIAEQQFSRYFVTFFDDIHGATRYSVISGPCSRAWSSSCIW